MVSSLDFDIQSYIYFRVRSHICCYWPLGCSGCRQEIVSKELHGYTVHQKYQTLYCPTDAHNVKNVELL